MITFSTDPHLAERQMKAIIFYLTTFGYIDGDFDRIEQDYVREYIRKLVVRRVEDGAPDADAALQAELVTKFTAHFHEIFEIIDAEVRELFTEAVANGEEQDDFIRNKLKVRCFEIFQTFDPQNQEQLMDAMDELIEADGDVHPAELKFRNELVALFEQDLGVELIEDAESTRATILDAAELRPAHENHPFFRQSEQHYSSDPATIKQQVSVDIELIHATLRVLEGQRAKGAGLLQGKKTVDELAGEAPFLDGHIYVHPTPEGQRFDLTVLGDLHGCYSCLKGAVLQANFFEKISAYKRSPTTTPKPLLVLLGDYIDRGLFSLNGVLRTVMQLLVEHPDHVYVLRGNHEFYLEYKGQVYGGVKPAESINSLKPHLPTEVFREYIQLFEALPTCLLFGRTLFVHAGIPRDRLLKEHYEDLSSLNHPDIRFQMMWSDPSSVDVVPAALQEQSARFPFGRLQAAAFLRRMGCKTLIRGHEKVNAGFEHTYDDDDISLITLFSAGGADNADLPPESSYRSVTPKACSIEASGDELKVTPFNIDYKTYNDPEHNAFFRAAPEIAHKA